MAKDLKYIRKRKRKYGFAYLVDIPFSDELGNSKHFTRTVKISDYGSDAAALTVAQRIRNEALADIQSGKIKIAFPTVRSLYESKFKLMPLASSTVDKQNSIFLHSASDLLDKPIDKVTIADIQSCVNAFALDHSDDGVHRFVSIWRQIYKVCQILEYPVTDKTTAIVIPKSKRVTQKKEVTLSAGELQIILDDLASSGKYNDRAIWYMLNIMYYTGCRPAEALALRRKDVGDTHISINKQIGSTSSRKLQEVPTKTAGSYRKVPIAHDLRPILDDLINWSSHDLLLARSDGTPLNISRVSSRLAYISKQHGIHFFSYKLRHQMSSDLMHAGDSVVARDLLGHSSFAMTLDYARSSDDQLYDAIAFRKLAEPQPKIKNTQPPSMDPYKTYSLMRFKAVLSLCIMEKAGFIAKK